MREYKHVNFQTRLDVALRQNDMFIVSSILAHEGTASKPASMKFKVHWLNTDHSEDTWEPFKELKNNLVLHNYLLRNSMGKLIPSRFRTYADFQIKSNSKRARGCRAFDTTNL